MRLAQVATNTAPFLPRNRHNVDEEDFHDKTASFDASGIICTGCFHQLVKEGNTSIFRCAKKINFVIRAYPSRHHIVTHSKSAITRFPQIPWLGCYCQKLSRLWKSPRLQIAGWLGSRMPHKRKAFWATRERIPWLSVSNEPILQEKCHYIPYSAGNIS